MKFGGPIDMLHGSLWDKVLAFTLPLVATALLQQLYNGADLTVLGQFVGKQAMAAVGNDIPVVGLFLSLLLGLSLGGNVVVAQLLGGGKYKEASKAVHTAFALSLIIGICRSGLTSSGRSRRNTTGSGIIHAYLFFRSTLCQPL